MAENRFYSTGYYAARSDKAILEILFSILIKLSSKIEWSTFEKSHEIIALTTKFTYVSVYTAGMDHHSIRHDTHKPRCDSVRGSPRSRRKCQDKGQRI